MIREVFRTGCNRHIGVRLSRHDLYWNRDFREAGRAECWPECGRHGKYSPYPRISIGILGVLQRTLKSTIVLGQPIEILDERGKFWRALADGIRVGRRAKGLECCRVCDAAGNLDHGVATERKARRAEPFKFAVIENLPAFLAGILLSWPIGVLKPDLPEAVQLAPSLLFALVLWYWIGSRLDRRWNVRVKAPWVSLAILTAVCLTGALIPIGNTGYLPYAFLVWLVIAIPFRQL